MHYKNSGNREASVRETMFGEAREGRIEEWNPDLESWDEFEARTSDGPRIEEVPDRSAADPAEWGF